MRTRKETTQRHAGRLERVARALYSVCVDEEPLANMMQVLFATNWRATPATSNDVAGGAGSRRISATHADYASWKPAVTLLNQTAQDYALATGLVLDGSPDALFANKQVPSDRGWRFHADGEAHGYEVVTAVLTLRSSDCRGGAIQFSNLADGSVDQKEYGERVWLDHVISFSPKHASVYVFPGSLVQHRPTNIEQGTRFSLVAFYRVRSDYIKFLSVWAGKEHHCPDCERFYASKRSLQKHKSADCPARKRQKK